MKLSRRMVVLLLVPVMGAMCQHEAVTEGPVRMLSDPDWLWDCVSPATTKVFVGDTVRFAVAPCGGTEHRTYLWHTTNPAIAEVDSITGLVRARSAGSTAVIATRVGAPGMKAAGLVEVSARP